LELRTPFVDREVFQLASEIQADLKISHGTTKFIIRQAAVDLIPAAVLNRKKLGFPVPIRFWLKNEMYDWAKQIINDSQTEEYFDKQYFLQLLEVHRSGQRDYSRQIWTVLTFMVWHKIYVESEGLFENRGKEAER